MIWVRLEQHAQVKLQVLNLGAKLYVTNREQTEKIFRHVLNLAKYDTNYDIRDRARMIRVLIFESDGVYALHLRRLFCTQKPAPNFAIEDRRDFVLGSMSHIVNHTAPNYLPIEEWPMVAPDRSTRDKAVRYFPSLAPRVILRF